MVAIGDCATLGRHPGDGAESRPTQPAYSSSSANRAASSVRTSDRSSGLPVINVPGCPAHPDWITQILVALATGRAGDHRARRTAPAADLLQDLHPDRLHPRPVLRVQAGDHASSASGTRTGACSTSLGCRGPMTHSPCNRILWNRQSSKTRAGMPCTGCTEPEYPFFDLAPGTVFKTQKVSGSSREEMPERTRPADLHGTRGGRAGRRPPVVEGRHVRRLTRGRHRIRNICARSRRTDAMPQPLQTLDIVSPLGRVEGDLDVRVTIEDGVVTVGLDRGSAVPRLRDHPAGQGPAGRP